MDKTSIENINGKDAAISDWGHDINSLVKLLYMTENPGYKQAAIRKISEKYKLPYRSARGLTIIFTETNSVKDMNKYLAPSFYELDNMVEIARGGDQLLKELIPGELYENEEFLDRADIDSLPDAFLEGNDTLLTFHIKRRIKRIGARAFAGCGHLIDVVYDKDSLLEEIGPFTFRDCRSLRSGILPGGVKHIGEGCFSKCRYLERIRLPGGIGLIKPYTFQECSRLKEIMADSPSLRVQECAFKNCQSLARVGGVILEIGSEAFAGCVSLKEAEISAPLISRMAFAGCGSLRSVHFRSAPALFDQDCFLGCLAVDKVTVNGSSCQLHSTEGWCELDRHIRYDSECPSREFAMAGAY